MILTRHASSLGIIALLCIHKLRPVGLLNKIYAYKAHNVRRTVYGYHNVLLFTNWMVTGRKRLIDMLTALGLSLMLSDRAPYRILNPSALSDLCSGLAIILLLLIIDQSYH